MGERTNVNVITETDGAGVWFYSHSARFSTASAVQAAIRRRLRWNDPPYLARMIFDALSDGCQGSEYGHGISAKLQNNEHPIFVVGPGPIVRLFAAKGRTQMASVPSRVWSFDAFCDQDGRELQAIYEALYWAESDDE